MTTKLAIASGLATLLFAGAPVAFAHDNNGFLGLGLHAGADVHADSDTDEDDGGADANASANAALHAKLAERLSHVTAGVVTSIDGALFTIDPFGREATTTVSTDAATVFKVHGREATSTLALSVGDRVFLEGSTTATSTAGDSFAASFVKILGRGFAYLRFWLRFR